jgi:hypothetical protein
MDRWCIKTAPKSELTVGTDPIGNGSVLAGYGSYA